MVRQIWLRIALLLVAAVLPITMVFLKLQAESVQLIFEIADQTNIRETLDTCLDQLRRAARENPARTAEFRGIFEQVGGVKRGIEEFFLARSSIGDDFKLQALVIAIVVLALSGVFSLPISMAIVKRFRWLLAEQQKAQRKVQDHAALQQWQTVARTLVHELRAPITPIKLIATDIDRKFQSMSHESFANYVRQAQEMLIEQVAAIERMITGFTQFGKLPAPVTKRTSWQEFLQEFERQYDGAFGPKVSLRLTPLAHSDMEIEIDSNLLRNLIFNVCRNASEANQGDTQISLTSTLSQADNNLTLAIHNTGRSIPPNVAARIFEPYVSGNAGADSVNMGLGLTIARKIAMDHGGDLRLLADAGDGVTFVLELPLNSGALSDSAKLAEELVEL
jgi:signal transduction histidine kinase